MEVPESFNFEGQMYGEFRMNIVDDEGEPIETNAVVANYTLEGNKLRVVFNDKLGGLTGRNGKGGFQLKFNLDEFKDDVIQRIEFEEPISKTFTVKLKPEGDHLKLISKSGKPNSEINATSISWEIDVNTSLDKLTKATVEDTIPEGL